MEITIEARRSQSQNEQAHQSTRREWLETLITLLPLISTIGAGVVGGYFFSDYLGDSLFSPWNDENDLDRHFGITVGLELAGEAVGMIPGGLVSYRLNRFFSRRNLPPDEESPLLNNQNQITPTRSN